MKEALSILLVEDDRHIAIALKIRLGAAGHKVALACSVAEALISVDTQAPDVAVLDVNLPDGDGIELMRCLQKHCDSKPIASIIMTASRKPGLSEHALAEGAIAFLEKPFSSTLLLEAVARQGSGSKAA